MGSQKSRDQSCIEMQPIGTVHNALAPEESAPRERAARSEIEINPEWVDGLQGIKVDDYIVILFCFDRSPEEGPLLQHPQGNRSRPRRGVFTLRSPLRPNPIGSTTVRVLEIHDNVLVVSGLDAFDGTPVLDIKPHIAWLDEPQEDEDWV